MMADTIYPNSVHAFMLPLKWDYLPLDYSPAKGKQEFDYDTRTDLSKINQKLEGTLFKRKFYRLNNSLLTYNELSYFHAYVANSIFDLQQPDEQTEQDVSKNKTVLYYETDVDSDSKFIVDTTTQIYTLNLTGISLHVFTTGIAVITFNIENYTYAGSEDILRINEFGRRFYPPFLAGTDGSLTQITKGAVLAKKIALELPGKYIEDDFSAYDSLAKKETHRFIHNRYEFGQIIDIPQYVVKLFNNEFVFGARQEEGDKIRINTIGDDRMFFQCWCGNTRMAENLKTVNKQKRFENNSFWFAFVNGDKSENEYSLGLKSEELMQKYNIKRTYRLWEGYGTFFGFTRDSFVCLSVDLKTNSAPDLRNHMRTLYYQMAILSLVQRASVLRFSSEISSLTDLGKTNPQTASKLIEKLYLNYIEFINKIYFREVTPQMQGIEMYGRMQKALNIKDDIKDLDDELAELHNFSMMIKQDIQNSQAVKLSRLATIFLPASLTFSILGANFFTGNEWAVFGLEGVWRNIFWILVGIIPSILFYLLVKFKIIKL